MKTTPKMKARPLIAAMLVVLVLVVLAAVKLAGRANPAEDLPTFEVKRGPLTISIDAAGTIKALDQEVIKCEVEGDTKILTLVPEGTRVKKGDLLIELDASKFEDQLIAEEMALKNAETTLISAQENLEVGKNQAQSDVEKAQLALDFAKEDLRKYQEGDYQNELTDAKAQIAVKQEAVEQARQKYDWSLKLYKEKYISETELRADKLALSKAELDLKLAENKLKLLQDFTYHRTIKQLTSDVHQAEMALERAKRKAKADVVQLEAALLEAQTRLERQKEVVRKLKDNIAKTKIYAPADGMVVYATTQRSRWSSTTEPLEEGQQVYERQELINLPTSDRVKAEVKIHESSMDKMRLGLPATITVDALPDRIFHGTVEKIALLPDAQMVWLNPDLKVYTTEIHLDEEEDGLRTGMSCRASIIIAEYQDVVYIPVQAVIRIGDQPTVYVVEDGRIKPRKVEIGLDNNRMVHVISGLEPGEHVLLTPPLAEAEVRGPAKRDAEDRTARPAPEQFPADSSSAARRDSTTQPGTRQAPGQPPGRQSKRARPGTAGPDRPTQSTQGSRAGG